jgi:hypothetical protein
VLEVLAGDLPRAPRWMQVGALGSLFQLLVAPRRYLRRYVLCDPPVLGAALVEALQRRARASCAVLVQTRSWWRTKAASIRRERRAGRAQPERKELGRAAPSSARGA